MLVCVAMLWDVAMHSMFVHYYINALARFLKADFVDARLIKKPFKKKEVYGWFQANNKVHCKHNVFLQVAYNVHVNLTVFQLFHLSSTSTLHVSPCVNALSLLIEADQRLSHFYLLIFIMCGILL